MPEAPREGETLEAACVAELVELQRDGALELAEIALDVLRAEEIVRAVAASRDQLERRLVLEDEVEGGETEARLILGQRVERADAFRREHAEEPEAEGVDDEGVAVAGAHRLEERGRIAQQRGAGVEPRQRAAAPRRHRIDGGQRAAHRSSS